MKKIIHFLFFSISTLICAAQSTTDYFIKLDVRLKSLQGNAKVDTIINIPYEIFSAHLNESEFYLHQALRLAKKNKYSLGVATAKHKLGQIHYYLGEYDSSSFYTLSALDDLLKMNEISRAANIYCDYGHMIKRRDLKKAFELMRKGLSLQKIKSLPNDLATCMNNFGVLHEMSHDIDSALFYYLGSLKINRGLNDSLAIPYNYVKIGTALLYKSKFENAKLYFDSAHFIRAKRNDLLGITDDHAYYGDLYKAWKKYDQAIYYFNECIRLSQSNGYPYLIQYSYEELSKCYEATGNTSEALRTFKEAQKIKDSLLSEKNTKTMLELEERFKSAEKEKIIAEQNQDIARRDLDIARKSRENILLYAFLSISIVVGIGITYFVLQKEKQKRQKALIEEREKGLKSVIETAENERRRIAKDLHDGVGQQLGGLKMAWQQLEKSLPIEEKQKMESLTGILNDTATEVRNISHQMMPKMLEQDGLQPALEDLLKKISTTTGIKVEQNLMIHNIRLKSETELTFYRVAQEIIANCIKHANATQITIDLYKRNGKIFMMIDDNGNGFDTSKNGAGLGLQNMKARMTAIKGDIEIESELGKGTFVLVSAIEN